MTYQANEKGYYGEFGGAFIPEMLYPNVEELRRQYLDIMKEDSFQKEFKALLKDYVGRPTPLYYAERFSKKYNTKVYLKREDLCHTGAHKVNNTVGQILMAKRLGKNRIIAETGAGQHGVATATVCALMGIECIVYMGEIDIERQAPNVARMKMLGAKVVPAKSGSKTLKDATNEAIRDWINNPVDTHYIIGSVVGPHPYPDMVARFQAIISEEIKTQLKEKENRENPDYVAAGVVRTRPDHVRRPERPVPDPAEQPLLVVPSKTSRDIGWFPVVGKLTEYRTDPSGPSGIRPPDSSIHKADFHVRAPLYGGLSRPKVDPGPPRLINHRWHLRSADEPPPTTP